MRTQPPGAGKSNFDLIDARALFSYLNLTPEVVFVDIGCGRGDYSLAAAEHIGENGTIYALDAWPEGIDQLNNAVAARNITTIRAMVADVSERMPIEDHVVDLCFMATVFHDLVEDNTHEGTLAEIQRVLKPNGTVAVVEFKKIEGPPGPSIRIRISPPELTTMLYPYGFRQTMTVDIGPYTYLTMFERHGSSVSPSLS